jgi:hypothetical protein
MAQIDPQDSELTLRAGYLLTVSRSSLSYQQV